MKAVHKTLQLQIRVSPAEKSAITYHAQKAGMSLSQWVLSRILPARQIDFQRLLGQLATSSDTKPILAEIHDLLEAASGDEFELMTGRSPTVFLSAYQANYVAAMVEYAAAKKERKAPFWTADIPPLERPVFGSALVSLRVYLLTHSPPPFRRRNIFIDSTIGKRV